TGLISTTTLQQGATPQPIDELGYPAASPLLHRTGSVVNALRPAGKVEIDGDVLDVVAEGDFVEVGFTVEVIQVEGNRVVVRRVEPA
ncbi:MAG: NfeD family protein, partial [Planctomycetota bacterium]